MEDEPEDLTWEALSAEILSGMREWRLQRLRARMLQDLALQSTAAHWKETTAAESPVCPACGSPLTLRGKQPRRLKTHGGQQLTLNRSYGLCPKCKKGL